MNKTTYWQHIGVLRFGLEGPSEIRKILVATLTRLGIKTMAYEVDDEYQAFATSV